MSKCSNLQKHQNTKKVTHLIWIQSLCIWSSGVLPFGNFVNTYKLPTFTRPQRRFIHCSENCNTTLLLLPLLIYCYNYYYQIIATRCCSTDLKYKYSHEIDHVEMSIKSLPSMPVILFLFILRLRSSTATFSAPSVVEKTFLRLWIDIIACSPLRGIFNIGCKPFAPPIDLLVFQELLLRMWFHVSLPPTSQGIS